MKYNRELLAADLRDELQKISGIVLELRKHAAMLERAADETPMYDRAAIGYFLHNFYNGCENVFRLIARFFENDLGPATWHADLLKRMKLSIPGFRPAVIDEELYRLLDDFRAFRHIFRQAYAFELDWDRERLVAAKLPQAANLLTEQVERFLTKLADLDTE
jgi:hypothetical protein